MEGIFVTGTDTGVGKTTIAAGLLKLLHGSRPVAYWKPIQTGTIIGDDTLDVKALTELDGDCYLEPAYRFVDPVAPLLAARKWKTPVDLDVIVKKFKTEKRDRFVIVEGAGGLLVPLTETALQDELIRRLGLPVVIVAENRLGTINQTLLTVSECRARNITVLGVILSRARQAGGLENAEFISHYGQVDVLADFTEVSDRRMLVAQVSCHSKLRELFKVAPLPT